MTLQRDTLKTFTDAAADAVARAIAGVQREAQRERDVRDAEHRARMAELDARIASVAVLERQVADRLATLKDGVAGRDGKDGLDGRPGKDADQEMISMAIAENVQRVLATWERPKDGRDGVDGKDGAAGQPGADGKDGRDGADGIAGRDGLDGKDGERGPEGQPGKLPTVRVWEDRVYYEGEVAVFNGATYQASRDTGRAPSHEDWICIAAAGCDGIDGRSFEIRGTYKADGEYRNLDVVVLNGASFAAKRDNPGACPGDGWQLIASQGKQGKPGDRGGPGLKGDRGLPGPAVIGLEVDGEGLLRLKNGDGSNVDVDLYPILSRLG
jgi:hypothetical protein